VRAALTIRPAVPEEADALSALCRRAKASHGYSDEFMRLLMADGDMVIAAEAIVRDTFVVAEIEGRTVGFAHLMPVDRPDTIYLEDLFIEPDVQGQGVGRALFKWALTEAGARGYAWLEWDSDPNAAAFYERLGAEKIGENQSTLIDGRMIPKVRMPTGIAQIP
jgi:GNAT superfamily N-acetyltransferase